MTDDGGRAGSSPDLAPGNEAERLTLMRQHQDRVNTQMRQLTKCLDLITYKIGVYEDIVERIGADLLST